MVFIHSSIVVSACVEPYKVTVFAIFYQVNVYRKVCVACGKEAMNCENKERPYQIIPVLMKLASPKCWLLIVLLAWLPLQEHSSIKSVSGNRIDDFTNNGGRQSRLLSFNNDESNIRVELNFAVPFLHIPVGRESLDHGKAHPVIDVNAKSLITASALLFMLLFVVPRLIRVFIPHASSRISRGIEENEEISKIVNIMDSVMNKMQIDRAACLQQAICTAVQSASKRVAERKASSWDKIIDGLASNVLLQHYTYGSSAYDAAMYGLMVDRNCSSKYEGCNSGIQKIINMAQTFLSRLE